MDKHKITGRSQTVRKNDAGDNDDDDDDRMMRMR